MCSAIRELEQQDLSNFLLREEKKGSSNSDDDDDTRLKTYQKAAECILVR